MAETPYLVDSNVLLRWVKPDHSDYPAILSALDVILAATHHKMLRSFGTPAPALSSATATGSRLRIRTFGRGSSRENYDCWWTVSPSMRNGRRLLVSHNISGVQVHDARLVAAMHLHEVKHILTFNDRDFARYMDIQAVNPRTMLHP